MSDEDQKLMEKISALAGKTRDRERCLRPACSLLVNDLFVCTGQINRHKNQQAGLLPTPSPTYGPSRRRFPSPSTQSLPREPSTDEKRDASAHARGGHYRGHHPYSTRGGYRVGKAPAHRHRTLVLNGTSGVNTVASDAAPASDASSPSWVTKNDRHLQLINSSVYQEQAEARNKAIEQTRLRKLQHKENRERSQFMSHLRQTANPSLAYTNPTSAPVYEIVVDGVKFAVVKGGSKLVKLPGAYHGYDAATRATADPFPGNPTAPETTPRVALVGGVKFRRTKNGNMYREAAVKAQRYVAHPGDSHVLTIPFCSRSGAVNKVNVPCKNFSNTGISLRKRPSLSSVPTFCHAPGFFQAVNKHSDYPIIYRILLQRPHVPLYPRSRQGRCLQDLPAKGYLCLPRRV